MKKPTPARWCRRCPPARPAASRTHRPSRHLAPGSSPPTAHGRRPGMFVPHFSQRRTVRRGALFCSSASRSRRRFPQRRPLRLPTAPHRPTDRNTHRAAPPAAAERPRPIGLPTAMSIERRPRGGRTSTPCLATPAPGLPTGGATGLSLRLPAAYRPQYPSSGGSQRQPDARGGFRPANAAHPLPHSSPQAAHKRLINSYKFLLSPAQFLAAAPIGPPLARSAIPHSGHRGGSLLIYFPLHGDEAHRFLFCCIKLVLPRRAARPPSGIVRRDAASSAARRPFPHDLRRAVPGIPTVRRLSASIHPLHSPHRPCPKIIVLRSASL